MAIEKGTSDLPQTRCLCRAQIFATLAKLAFCFVLFLINNLYGFDLSVTFPKQSVQQIQT